MAQRWVPPGPVLQIHNWREGPLSKVGIDRQHATGQAAGPQRRLNLQSSGIRRRGQTEMIKHKFFRSNKACACKQECPFCSNRPAMDCHYPPPTLTLPLWHAYTVVLGWTSVTGGPICSPRDRPPWSCGIRLAAPPTEQVASSRCRLMVRSIEPDTTARSLVHGKKCTPKMFASC